MMHHIEFDNDVQQIKDALNRNLPVYPYVANENWTKSDIIRRDTGEQTKFELTTITIEINVVLLNCEVGPIGGPCHAPPMRVTYRIIAITTKYSLPRDINNC